jgi:hypothetical protein
MGKHDPEVQLASRTDARAALAEAISALAELDAEIAAGAAAVEAAQDGQREARRRLRLLDRPESVESGPSVAAFIGAVQTGGAIDVVTFAPGAQAKKLEKAALEAEADRWGELLAACQASLEELKQRRVWATQRREKAVAEVIRQSGVARAFLQNLANLQAEVFARRLVLCRLVAGHLVADDEAAEIREVLNGLQSPLPQPEFMLVQWRDWGAGARWQAALDNLATDANAALPTLAGLLAPAA